MPEGTGGAVILSIEAGIARLILSRPARLNAFNAAMHGDLRAALDQIEADDTIRVLILTGAGKAFSAGQDLVERHDMLAQGEVDLSFTLHRDYNRFVRRLAALRFPVIAAVNGIAVGAAAAIAIGCDLTLAAASARFQFPFARVALGPDAGTSWFLPNQIGLQRAMGLALTGEPIDAATAERWGLIWRCVPDETLSEEIDAMARLLCGLPRSAVTSIKHALRHNALLPLDQALERERDEQGRLGRLPDYREAVGAFMEKRTPRFA